MTYTKCLNVSATGNLAVRLAVGIPGKGMSMGKLSRILVPVDGSSDSDKAVDMAVTIAAACGTVLDILCVSYFDSATDAAEDDDTWLPDFVAAPAGHRIREILEKARSRVPEGVRVELHQRNGNPAKKILEFSHEHGDETIVVGAKGLGFVRGFLLGSVSQEVMESAQGAVIIVK